MNKLNELLKLISEAEDKHIQAAHKMVDNIEKRRTKGKYTPQERTTLVNKFVKNIKGLSGSKDKE